MQAAYRATLLKAVIVGATIGLAIGVARFPFTDSLGPLLIGPLAGIAVAWLVTQLFKFDHIQTVTRLTGRRDTELLGPAQTRTFELAVPYTRLFALCKEILFILGYTTTLADNLGDGEGEIQAQISIPSARYPTLDLITFTVHAIDAALAEVVVTCQPTRPGFDFGRNLNTMLRIERFFEVVRDGAAPVSEALS